MQELQDPEFYFVDDVSDTRLATAQKQMEENIRFNLMLKKILEEREKN